MKKNATSARMTQEWIDWTGDNRIRTPLRGGGCNNYLNNNYTSNKMAAAAGMGLKTQSMMKSLQRPKGISDHSFTPQSPKCQRTTTPILRWQINASHLSVADDRQSKQQHPSKMYALVQNWIQPFESGTIEVSPASISRSRLKYS